MGIFSQLMKKKEDKGTIPPPPGKPEPDMKASGSDNSSNDKSDKKEAGESKPPMPNMAPGSKSAVPNDPIKNPSDMPQMNTSGKKVVGDTDQKSVVAPASKMQVPDPKTIFNVMHNQNPPPDFRPEEVSLPKFDLPNFPKGYPNLNFDIPTYGGSVPGEAKAPVSQEDAPKQEQEEGKSQEQEKPVSPPPVQAQKQSNTAIPDVTPLDSQGNFTDQQPKDKPEDVEMKTQMPPPIHQQEQTSPAPPENSNRNFQEHNQQTNQNNMAHHQDMQNRQQQPSHTDEMQMPESAPRKNARYVGSLDAGFKRNSYHSKEEEKLTFAKKQLHHPRQEPGTDMSRIGNVENVINRRIKDPKTPVFIEINQYKKVLDSMDELKRDMNDSHEMILKLDEFNVKKHSEFGKWKKVFENINSKLKFVHKIMFEQSE